MSKLTRLLVLPTFAALAGTGAAYADPDVFIGGGLGIVQHTYSYGSNSESFSGHQFEGFASAAYNFTPVLGAQGDIVVNIQNVDYDGYAMSRTNLDGALHLFYRDSERFLLGGFVQLGSSGYDFDGYTETFHRSYAGVEGQVFVDSLTLYGQLGLSRFAHSEESDFAFDGYFATIEARYFLTPDFKIEGHLGVGAFDTSRFDLTTHTFNIGASAEYRFSDSPFSLFAKYDYDAVSASYGSDTNTFGEHRFLIGAKFNFGSETLLDRDRSGASLKPVSHSLGSFEFAN